MSLKVSQRVWERSQTTGSVRLLMLGLADYARDDGIAWPSLRSLAVKLRTSKRNVIRLVAKAQAAGELDVAPGGSGRGDRTTYRLNPERVTAAPPKAADDRVTEPSPKEPERVTTRPERVTNEPLRVTPGALRVTGRSSPSRTVRGTVSQNGQANLARACAKTDDPTDEALIADLRRFAASANSQIADHARKRLEALGPERAGTPA